ncbi:MAG: SDR family oxidoreductase [Devosia sp.]
MPIVDHSVPSQTGKRAIITGATGGLGYETALVLAGAGAEVILAGRNAQKGSDALARIRAKHPRAQVSFEMLDLARLQSVHDFANRMAAASGAIDILVNNAGVMALPKRSTTPDGFETQFAVNYLGHFALTALLLPQLSAAKARVVQLSSIAARQGKIDFDDLQAERSYKPFRTYSQSKLATLMFGLELQRRSDAWGWGLTSVSAHPGVALTELIPNGPGQGNIASDISRFVAGLIVPMLGHSAEAGARSQIFAATSDTVTPGGYYGPDGMSEMRGNPHPATFPQQSLDAGIAARLWTVSEQLIKVTFSTLEPSA